MIKVNKSFEEIYESVCKSSKERIDEVKRKNNKFILYVFIVEVIINLILYIVLLDSRYMITLTISVSIAILIILIVNARKNYRTIYKKCVIESLVKEYNEDLNFDQAIGVSRIDYKISNFDSSFDEFHSEDRIYGKLRNGGNIQASEIASYNIEVYKDANGNRKENRIETFRGMYGFIKLDKNSKINLQIASNNNIKRFSKNRIEVDSAEFEKYYDLYTQDKVTAMQIFTSDLIEKYIDIINISNYPFELKIIDDCIYFRYNCGQMFEPPTFRNGLDEKLIRKYYKLIFYPMEVLEKTVEHIYSVLEMN